VVLATLALLPALAITACAPPPQQAVRGEHPRIVSLNPCTDAILVEVARPGQIAALSAYSRDPAATSISLVLARSLPATSGTVEEIAPLRPDLVIGSTFTSPATRAALARLGIPLAEVPIAATAEESIAQVRRIAALARQGPRGEALVARIEAALAAAAPPPGAGAPITAVVWQSGGIVPGESALISDLMRRTGFASLSAARGLGQADYLPLERMIADPPRVILAAGESQSSEDRLLSHPALRELKGTVRMPFDPTLLWCGGPTMIRASARLAEVRRTVLSAAGAVPKSPFPQAAGFGGGQSAPAIKTP